jgi:hypothetical protein
MDQPLHLQGTQGATLHASYPSTHPDRLCDWTVTSVTGAVDTLEYSEWVASLPSRIESVSILNTLLFPYLVIILIVIWAFGLNIRSSSFPIRRAADASGKTWLKDLVDLVVYVAGFTAICDGSQKSCVALYAFKAALGGGLLDSAGMLLTFALVFNNQMIPGIALSLAYAFWAPNLSILPWRQTATASRYPNYKAILANLRPEHGAARMQRRAGAEQEDGICAVCWSSHKAPLELSGKVDDLLCSGCLARVHEAHRYIKIKLLEFIIACIGAHWALTLIDFALNIYKGSYQDAAIDLFLAVPLRLIVDRHFRISSAASGGYLASWQTRTLAFHALNLVAFACRLVYRLRQLDQATFFDGEFISGLEVATAVTLKRSG